MAQEGQGLHTRPVQILEDDDRRPTGRRLTKGDAKRLVEPVTSCVRIPRQHVTVVGHSLAMGEQRAERSQLAGHGPCRKHRQQLLHGLHPRLIRDSEVVVTTAEEHGRPRSVDEPGELRRQARLARSGFTPDEDNLTPGTGNRPGSLERRQRRLPADEGVGGWRLERQWERRRPTRVGGHRRRPLQLVGRCRMRQPPDGQRPDQLAASGAVAVRQQADDVGDEDLATSRRSLQPSGGADGRPPSAVSSHEMSPAAMPMRIPAADVAATNCMSTAASRAGAAAWNATIKPSPDDLTTRPPWRRAIAVSRRASRGASRWGRCGRAHRKHCCCRCRSGRVRARHVAPFSARAWSDLTIRCRPVTPAGDSANDQTGS